MSAWQECLFTSNYKRAGGAGGAERERNTQLSFRSYQCLINTADNIMTKLGALNLNQHKYKVRQTKVQYYTPILMLLKSSLA